MDIGTDGRNKFLTQRVVKLIDRLLSEGWSVGYIAARLDVTPYLVGVIAADEERHRTRRGGRKRKPKPPHPHNPPRWSGMCLDPGETLLERPARCPVCGARILVVPCRTCRARAGQQSN